MSLKTKVMSQYSAMARKRFDNLKKGTYMYFSGKYEGQAERLSRGWRVVLRDEPGGGVTHHWTPAALWKFLEFNGGGVKLAPGRSLSPWCLIKEGWEDDE